MSSDEQRNAGPPGEPADQEEPEAPQDETEVPAPADTSEDAEDADAHAGESEEPQEEPEGSSESEAPAEPAVEPRAPGPPRWLVQGSAALAVAGFIVAAVFGVMWWVASGSDSAALASARENVVRAAGRAVTAYTELDYEHPDEYFSRQKEVTTGDLLKQITKSEKTYRDAIAQAKTKVVSTVQDVGVEELNQHEGKASALVMVSTKVTQGGKEGTKVLRLEVEMSRVDDGGDQVWKLSQIGEVPVAGTGQ